MKIRKIIILAVDVWRQSNKDASLEKWLSLPKSESQISLRFYRPDGLLVGSRDCQAMQGTPPSFWGSKIKRTLIPFPDNIIDEYSYWIALAELEPSALPEILSENKKYGLKQWSKNVHDLFNNIFPTSDSHRIPTTDPLASFSYLVYIEPEIQEFDPALHGLPQLHNFTRHALELIQISHEIACIPHLLMDLLILPGIGWFHFEDELVAVNIKPMPSEDDLTQVSLPKSLFQLAEYLAFIRIYSHLESRLVSLPFFKMDIVGYLKNLNQDKDPITSYGRRFLDDRVNVGAERHTVSQLTHDLSMKINMNYVAMTGGLQGSYPVEGFSQHPLRYNLLDHVKGSLSKYQIAVQDTLKILEQRESALADYLRDITIHHSTEANLLLQKSIRRITFIAVVVALLSLIIALLPDQVKITLYDFVRHILNI